MMKPTLLATLALLIAIPALSAQGDRSTLADIRAQKASKQAMLGRFLFRSKELSLDRTISCASCHKANAHFADGLKEPDGILGIGAGRNAPTLVGIRHVALFPGARRGGSGQLAADALTLAERCLAPIENPLEMGSSIKEAVRRIKKIKGMKERFNEAFGASTSGITPKRMGVALAAFLSGIDVPRTRLHDFVEGNHGALNVAERRGYDLFVKASCTSCHNGPALSDGRMHPIMVPGSKRSLAKRARATQIARTSALQVGQRKIKFPREGLAQELFEANLRNLVQGGGGCDNMGGRRVQRGGYGGNTPGVTIEEQTLPLWNITQTGPYFRDGSAATLKEALLVHVNEMKAVQKSWDLVQRNLDAQRRSGLRPHNRLVSEKRKWTKNKTLAQLNSMQLGAIETFLGTLVPKANRQPRLTIAKANIR